MSVSRVEHITPIGVEKMGDLANSLNDPEILRLENLDTDLRPPEHAIQITKQAAGCDDANSYLPFFGLDSLRQAATERVNASSGHSYNWKSECLISAGGLSGILNVLLATLEPGDEVLVTDPIYVGLINRIRLAGGVPRFLPLIPSTEGWRLDIQALGQMRRERIKAVLMMSPSMPTGAVFTKDEWQAVTEFCHANKVWLIYNAAKEQILFDGLEVLHPASFPHMREWVITVGSASKEYRMIGWRVGWIIGPEAIMADVARVSISNVCCQTGIGMEAVASAISDKNNGIREAVLEWEKRRDFLLNELGDFNPIPPHGGWCFLMDVSPLGLDGAIASKRLLELGKVAATPMTHWGSPSADRYIRLVFSNEPLERLRGIGERFKRALT